MERHDPSSLRALKLAAAARDPQDRRLIVKMLQQRTDPATASEICAATGMERQRCSRQLHQLHREGKIAVSEVVRAQNRTRAFALRSRS